MSKYSFEAIIKAQVAEIKQQLQSITGISHFEFNVEASGRPDGDVTISFGIGKYGQEVKGDSVDAVVMEFLRRHGWNERHAPLCLPNVEPAQAATDNDEIPF